MVPGIKMPVSLIEAVTGTERVLVCVCVGGAEKPHSLNLSPGACRC